MKTCFTLGTPSSASLTSFASHRDRAVLKAPGIIPSWSTATGTYLGLYGFSCEIKWVVYDRNLDNLKNIALKNLTLYRHVWNSHMHIFLCNKEKYVLWDRTFNNSQDIKRIRNVNIFWEFIPICKKRGKMWCPKIYLPSCICSVKNKNRCVLTMESVPV